MSELREPLLSSAQDLIGSPHYPGPVFRPEPPNRFPAHPSFLDTMEEADTNSTVVQLGSQVNSAVLCYNGVAFGLESGTVGLLEASGDIRELGYHSQSVQALSTKGNLLASGSRDGTAQLWNLDTHQQSPIRSVHTSPVGVVEITTDGRFVLSASEDGTLPRTSVLYGTEGKLPGHEAAIRCIAVNLMGNIVTGAENGEVKLWNNNESYCLHTFTRHTARVTCVALTSNNLYAVSGSADGTLKVWNLSTLAEQTTMRGHEKAVLCCTVTFDCSKLISGSEDTKVRVTDLATMLNSIVFTGHRAPVTQVYATLDSKYLLSASVDVIVCSLDDPQELARLSGHTATVTGLCLTLDYQYIVSTSLDGTLRIWGKRSDHETVFTKPVVSYPSISPAAPIQYPEINLSAPAAPVQPTSLLLQEEDAYAQMLGSNPDPPKTVWWGYKCSVWSVIITLVICFFILTSD